MCPQYALRVKYSLKIDWLQKAACSYFFIAFVIICHYALRQKTLYLIFYVWVIMIKIIILIVLLNTPSLYYMTKLVLLLMILIAAWLLQNVSVTVCNMSLISVLVCKRFTARATIIIGIIPYWYDTRIDPCFRIFIGNGSLLPFLCAEYMCFL